MEKSQQYFDFFMIGCASVTISTSNFFLDKLADDKLTDEMLLLI